MKTLVLLLLVIRLNAAHLTHWGDKTAREAKNLLGEVHDLYESHDYHAPGATDFFPKKFLGMLLEVARKQVKQPSQNHFESSVTFFYLF